MDNPTFLFSRMMFRQKLQYDKKYFFLRLKSITRVLRKMNLQFKKKEFYFI